MKSEIQKYLQTLKSCTLEQMQESYEKDRKGYEAFALSLRENILQNVLKNGYYCVIIKRENLVLFATEFWKRKDNSEALLEKINYLR